MCDYVITIGAETAACDTNRIALINIVFEYKCNL